MKVVFTCEHASNRVPARWASLFVGRQRILETHWGWDIGAAWVARRLAKRLGAPLVEGRWSRLLVELNKSPDHPRHFSKFAARLGAADKRTITDLFWRPHREKVTAMVADGIRSHGRVFHIMVHSFTPVLGGDRRRADIGLLYDPKRAREKTICGRWRELLGDHDDSLRVRRNYPYLGINNGLIPDLRRTFAENRYVGMELELNQMQLGATKSPRARWLLHSLEQTLGALLGE